MQAFKMWFMLVGVVGLDMDCACVLGSSSGQQGRYVVRCGTY